MLSYHPQQNWNEEMEEKKAYRHRNDTRQGLLRRHSFGAMRRK